MGPLEQWWRLGVVRWSSVKRGEAVYDLWWFLSYFPAISRRFRICLALNNDGAAWTTMAVTGYDHVVPGKLNPPKKYDFWKNREFWKVDIFVPTWSRIFFWYLGLCTARDLFISGVFGPSGGQDLLIWTELMMISEEKKKKIMIFMIFFFFLPKSS